MNNIKFKTYSWGYGTTSFRVSELKYKIEKQLILLKELKDKGVIDKVPSLSYNLIVKRGKIEQIQYRKSKNE